MSAPIDTEGLLQAIGALKPKREGAGRVIMLTSGRRGEGVTGVACALVQAAGPESVLALDLDLRGNRLARALAEKKLGEAISGDLGGVSLCTLLDSAGARIDAEALSYRQVGRSNVRVGVLNARAIPAGAKLRISPGAAYWDAARASGVTLIVDAPAVEQGKASLAAARHMDGIILVVGGGEGAAPAALAAKRALDGAGARTLGIVYAGAQTPLERWFAR